MFNQLFDGDPCWRRSRERNRAETPGRRSRRSLRPMSAARASFARLTTSSPARGSSGSHARYRRSGRHQCRDPALLFSDEGSADRSRRSLCRGAVSRYTRAGKLAENPGAGASGFDRLRRHSSITIITRIPDPEMVIVMQSKSPGRARCGDPQNHRTDESGLASDRRVARGRSRNPRPNNSPRHRRERSGRVHRDGPLGNGVPAARRVGPPNRLSRDRGMALAAHGRSRVGITSTQNVDIKMAIMGVAKAVYGVDDLDTSTRFFTDYGLDLIEKSAEKTIFDSRTARRSSCARRPIRPCRRRGSTATASRRRSGASTPRTRWTASSKG